MRRFILLLISFSISFLFIIGCSKPEDVRQEIWDDGYGLVKMIDDKFQNGENLTGDDKNKISLFDNKYSKLKDLSGKEKGIIIGILMMEQASLKNQLARESQNSDIDRTIELYEVAAKPLKDLYGIK